MSEPLSEEFKAGVKAMFDAMQSISSNTDNSRDSETIYEAAESALEIADEFAKTKWSSITSAYERGYKAGSRRRGSTLEGAQNYLKLRKKKR